MEERGEIMITGGTHARELVSVSYCLFIVKTLVTDPTPEQAYLLKTRTLWLIPVLNVDGYTHISDYYLANHHLLQVRKNLHGDYKCRHDIDVGVDLNRNFGYKWGHDDEGSSNGPCEEDYRGPSPFSEPET